MYSYILFLCEEIDHTLFLINMEKALGKLNFKCLYIVSNFPVYLKIKHLTKCPVFLVTKKCSNCDYKNALNAREYVEGSLNKNDTIRLYQSCWEYFKQLESSYNIMLFCASQGVRIAEIAMKDFCKYRNKKVVFFELSNVPGKTFWDSEGSNATSYFYKHPEILDQYTVSDSDWNQWKKEYLARNLEKHIVLQQVDFKRRSIIYGLLVRFSFLYTGLKTRKIDLLTGVLRFLKSKIVNITFDEVNLRNEQYIFFPMQVASDSQIVLNSDIGLFEALEFAVKEAAKEELLLIVKLHPAEKDVDIINKTLKYREKYHFKIVDDNTFLVIQNAQKIITINSTVALEAMILGVHTMILGRSYYKFFTPENVKQYILGHLINLDFFATAPFDQQEVEILLKRFL